MGLLLILERKQAVVDPYLLAIFVYFVYCIYLEHRVFFRQRKDSL